ncbi:MAG: hypothetical protein PHE27_01015 [Alphaproteobacteria bacterium]|nr:hypothetical protein [Alphaproteobacteria bacterium]
MTIVFFHTVSTVRDYLNDYVQSRYETNAAPIEHIVEPIFLTGMSEDAAERADLYRQFADKISRLSHRADKILITCSTLGDFVEEYRKSHPGAGLYRIDGPMAREAVKLGRTIGIAVTNRTTVDPSTALVRKAAQEISKDVSPNCFDCKTEIMALDKSRDPIESIKILEALNRNFSAYDAVILAQVSIGRIIGMQDYTFSVPVLSSIASGIAQLELPAKTAP